MKKLQDIQEENWGLKRPVTSPSHLILLLHGLNERGRRIFRKLIPYLPEDALILAPNGTYPIPRENNLGYAWYFFNRTDQTYQVTPEVSVKNLSELVQLHNPQRLPVKIIGFSQGGYLAPQVGGQIPETEQVIGLGCEFRERLVPSPRSFLLQGIHGALDEVVSLASSKTSAQILNCEWYEIPDCKHEINSAMGLKVKELLESYGKKRL